MPASGRTAVRTATGRPVADLPFLARMVASLESVVATTERTAPYIDLLDRVLEDRLVTEDEAEALLRPRKEIVAEAAGQLSVRRIGA